MTGPEFAAELLARARRERTPSTEARERVFRGVASSAALVGAGATAAPSIAGKFGAALGKWFWLGSGVVTAGAASWLVRTALPRAPVAGVASAGAVTAKAAPPAAQAQPSRAPLVPPQPALATRGVGTPPAQRSKVERSPRNLEEELRSLQAAQRAYRAGEPQQALEALAADRARFPRSQLGHERAILEVLTLCQLGRVADARRLASKLGAAPVGLEDSCAISRER